MCSAESIHTDTPIVATPTTTVEKKNPDRTLSSGRRVIADMRRANVGIAATQYYPVRVPPIESIALLLAPMAVSFHGFSIEMTKSDIAAAFRLLRVRPASSLPMCTELRGGFLGRPRDLVLFYLPMPFGWNGAPARFTIFGDAISS